MNYNKYKRLDYITICLILMGTILIGSGVRMNQFVSTQNNGVMPIKDWNGKANNPFSLYENVTDNTRFVFLADRQNWFGFSIGDIVQFGGSVFLVVACSMLYLRSGK